MIPLPTPPWLVALDRIGPGHGHTALRCLEVLRGEDRDIAGALTELAEVALGADPWLLPDISTVVDALEALMVANDSTGELANVLTNLRPLSGGAR